MCQLSTLFTLICYVLGILSFIAVLKLRLMYLLKERQERSGGLADQWLNNEALAVGDVHKSGTFRHVFFIFRNKFFCLELFSLIFIASSCLES